MAQSKLFPPKANLASREPIPAAAFLPDGRLDLSTPEGRAEFDRRALIWAENHALLAAADKVQRPGESLTAYGQRVLGIRRGAVSYETVHDDELSTWVEY